MLDFNGKYALRLEGGASASERGQSVKSSERPSSHAERQPALCREQPVEERTVVLERHAEILCRDFAAPLPLALEPAALL